MFKLPAKSIFNNRLWSRQQSKKGKKGNQLERSCISTHVKYPIPCVVINLDSTLFTHGDRLFVIY